MRRVGCHKSLFHADGRNHWTRRDDGVLPVPPKRETSAGTGGRGTLSVGLERGFCFGGGNAGEFCGLPFFGGSRFNFLPGLEASSHENYVHT